MRRKIILENAAAKRLLGVKRGEKVETGTLITKLNAQKVARVKELPSNPTTRIVAVMGLI